MQFKLISENIKALLQTKKNTYSFLILIFLLVFLPIALILVRQTQIFSPRAATAALLELAEGDCISVRGDKKVVTCGEFAVKVANPFLKANPSPSIKASLAPGPSGLPSGTYFYPILPQKAVSPIDTYSIPFYIKSDKENAVNFKAFITFNEEVQEVVSIDTAGSAVTNFFGDGKSFDNQTGEIFLGGTVASPGIKTAANSAGVFFAKINFRTKTPGRVVIMIHGDSGIYSASNVNLKDNAYGPDWYFDIGSTASSPSPSGTANCGTARTIRATTFPQMKQALSDLECSGGAVYIPAGSYSIPENLSVPSNVTLFGDGDSTVLTVTGHESGISNKARTGGDVNVVIRDLKVVGNGGDLEGGCCYGIRLRSLSDSFIINVTVEAFSGDGIYVGYKHEGAVPRGVKNVRITGCKLSRNDRQQIGVLHAEGVVIDHCSIDADGWGNGIDLEPDAGGDTFAKNNIIRDNNVFGPSAGITLLGVGGESGDPDVVTGNAICYNNVTVSGVKYANGGNNNIFVGNQGGNIDNLGGTIANGPESACTIPAALEILPPAPAKPVANQGNHKSINLVQILSEFGSSFSKLNFVKEVYALGLSQALQNSPYKNMLVSYWNFDEVSGNQVADINFQSATGTGTAFDTTIVDGKFGKARMIPAGGSIKIPNYGEFGDRTMSVSAWVKPSSFPVESLIWRQPEGTFLGYTTVGDGSLECVIKPIRENQESTFSVKSSGNYILAKNTWNHVACTFDEVTLKLYVNGSLAASGAKSGWLNKHYPDQLVDIGSGLEGAIDDMAYWNRALTEAEISSIYNGGKGMTIEGNAGNSVQASPLASASSVSSPVGSSSQSTAQSQGPYFFRLAETEAGLESALWVEFTSDPQVSQITLKDTSIGSKQVWVEFKDSSGNTQKDHITVDLVDKDPEITGADCTLDLAKDNIKVHLKGSRFGDKEGSLVIGYNLTVDDLNKGNKANFETLEWKPNDIVFFYKQGSLSANVDQRLNIAVIRTDLGRSDLVSCAIDQSGLSVGAKVFCRDEGKFDVSNVKVSLFYNPDNKPGTEPKRIDETVTINKEGIVQGLKEKLQVDRNYVLSIKAPYSVRRNANIKPARGTTIVTTEDGNPFILPIGDIAPTGNFDGKINTLDRAELMRQWRNVSISSAQGSELTADFNKDTRVNSIDWACMRYDFDAEDEPVPTDIEAEEALSSSGGSGAEGNRRIISEGDFASAGSSSLPSPASTDVTLIGTVTLSPLCPTEPCNLSASQLESIYENKKLIVSDDAGKTVIKYTTLDKDGNYKLTLSPGAYTLTLENYPNSPRNIIVSPGDDRVVNLDIDTGIR